MICDDPTQPPRPNYLRPDHTCALCRKNNECDQMNPCLWEEFAKLTLKRISQGRKHGGAKYILETVRWDTPAATIVGDDYKCPNGLDTFFARKFDRQYPQHRGFFRSRTSAMDGCFVPL